MSVYDPVKETVEVAITESQPDLMVAQNLVYYPPNQKMYFIRNDGSAYEITLDRSNFSKSTITKMTGITGSLPPRVLPYVGEPDGAASETGWAYDSVNQII